MLFRSLSNPINVLKILNHKLKNKDSKIFIDTPKIFWIYDFFSYLNSGIYRKILNGTIDQDHQQIWTKKSFCFAIRKSGYEIVKFVRLSEYTQPADFYLRNMKVKSPLIKLLGYFFYLLSPLIAKNKIMSLIEKK